jgi:ribosomal protein L11 methyltransferase
LGYYEFEFTCDDSLREPVIGLLSLHGVLGVVENPEGLAFYFSDLKGIDSVLDTIKGIESALINSGLIKNLNFNYTYLSERDWNETWKKRFIPIKIADKLTILPPWETSRSEGLNILIDPGMAFGTGHHETTQQCIELILEYSGHVNLDSFVDLGTGTGILAIAASLMGFKEVVAIDNDPLAIDAAKRNIELNDISNIKLVLADVSEARGLYDMVTANLLFNTLWDHRGHISALVKSKGIAVLSGLIRGQEEELLPALTTEGMRLLSKVAINNWVTLILTRP